MKQLWKNHKKIAAALLCICLLAGSMGVTYAYLIAQAERENTLVVGETKIEIEEEFEPPDELEPGKSFRKAPKLVNTGKLECFVRMRVDFSNPNMAELCELDYDTTKWKRDDSDGYYYYTEKLPVGGKTDYLFENVTIKTMHNGAQVTVADMEEFEILIYAEAVEHKKHAGDCESLEYKAAWDDYKGGN